MVSCVVPEGQNGCEFGLEYRRSSIDVHVLRTGTLFRRVSVWCVRRSAGTSLWCHS